MLIKLAKALNVSTDYLLGLTTEKTIDASGLSEIQLAHIRQIIDDIRHK
jgi:hypothetical protein